MLVLDKSRAVEQMLWLSDRRRNAVPTELSRKSPMPWLVAPDGRRVLTGAVVLREAATPESEPVKPPVMAPASSQAKVERAPAHPLARLRYQARAA